MNTNSISHILSKKRKEKIYKVINIIIMMIFVLNMTAFQGILLAYPIKAEAVPPPNPDFASVTWSPYEINGHVVTDWEDNVCGINDVSKGPANVAPDSVDLASNATEGPPCENPGTEPTLQAGEDTDYFYFRIRLADTPLTPGGGSLYDSYHWDVLIETNGDNYSDYVLDLNGSDTYGGNGSNYQGVLGLYTNNPNAQTYDPANHVWQAGANRNSNIFTQVTVTSQNANQYWLDLALPKSEAPFASFNSLFASTSASNTDPLQKDWMASEAFFIELTKNKTVENLTHPGYTTVTQPAQSGDTLRYTLSVTNSGNRTAPGFIIEDDVSDIVEYTSNPFNLSDSGTYNTTTKYVSWPQQDIAAGVTISETFDVTINPIDLWPQQGDFTISNVYGDYIDVPFCSLEITKQVSDTDAEPGDILTYTLSFENVGTADCTGTGVRIDDVVPVGITYNGNHTETTNVNFGYTDNRFSSPNPTGFDGSRLSWNAHTLTPGEVGTVTWEATVDAIEPCTEADIYNTATIYSNQIPQGIESNRVATHITTICNGSLKVYKYVDSGSATPDQWEFTIAGHGTQSPNSGENYVIFYQLPQGTYTATESNLAGYHQVSTTCTDVSVYAGQQSECEFHNARDTGTITVNKKVDTDGNGIFEGGNSEATNLGFVWGINQETPARAMGSSETVVTGNYNITENNVTGYHFAGWYYNLSGLNCENPYSYTLPANIDVGQNGTEITLCNARDTQTITVNKNVDTDGDGQVDIYGATDWTWDIAGGEQNIATGSSRILVTGTYTISEDMKTDYHVTDVTCNGQSYGAQEWAEINLTTNGVECTFTNTRNTGTLTVIKQVVNDNGGNAVASEWTMHVTGPENHSFPGQESPGVLRTVMTGDYQITESGGQVGYALTYGGNCDANGNITINQGDNKTCILINNDVSPSITLIKDVINDNGGTAGANDFGLTIGGTLVNSGQTLEVNANTPIALNEAGLFGYSFVSITGTECPQNLGDTVTLDEDEHIICTITNNDIAPELTVIKHVINNNGGTAVAADFTMNVIGTNVSNSSFSGDETGNTITLDQGSYSVDEDFYFGYAKTLSADCSGTINVGETKTCTITNDDISPTITLYKDVQNNHGGNAVPTDFTLIIDGFGITQGVATNVGANFPHTIDELPFAGYTFVNITGDQRCPSALGGTATLLPGENIICTIANEDISPSITLIKNVINDNGGNAGVNDFGLTIGGTNVNSGDTLNVNSNTPIALNETGFAGYSFVSITGDAKCPQNLGGTATLDENEHITCTITNDDIAPTLTLVKHVVNDNGGTLQVSDFPLFIDATQVTSGVAETVMANQQYTASETEDPGYTASSWSGDCATNGTITLLPGENKVCEITNDDIAPTLTLVKTVINDNGGTQQVADFPLYIDSQLVTSGVPETVMANQQHNATEVEDPGYLASNWGTDCAADGTITLLPGENKTCTITNNDIAPELTVIKHVINDNGGTAVAADFTINVIGTNVSNSSFSGDETGNTVTLDQGSYSVDEDFYFGYAKTLSADCSGTINVGETKTCTITNDDEPAYLVIEKDVINDNGGTELPNAWLLSATGPTSISGNGGVSSYVDAGTYTLSETGPDGYTASAWICGGGSLNDNQLTLGSGESANCVITNDDVAPTITLIKAVNNDHEGTAIPADFTLTIDSVGVTQSVANAVTANTPHAIDEVMVDGYRFVSLAGDAQCPSDLGGTVTLLPGEDITCTITNEDIAPPVLDLNKSVSPGAVLPGENLVYTIEWHITGEADAHNVTITDPVPANTTFVSADSGGVHDTNSDTVTWGLGTKSPGDSGIVTMTVTTNELVAEGTIITNIATIDSDDTDPPVSDDATAVVLGEASPILQITKDVSDEVVNPGDIITYTVVITNVGGADAINVTLTDVLPSNLTFVDGGDNTKIFTLGDLAIGDSVTKTYDVVVSNNSGAGTYTNTATAEADNPSPISAQTDVAVVLPTVLGEETNPDLAITKTANVEFANPGNTVEYTVKITNNGDGDATNVTLTDQLPSGFTFDGTTDSVKAWELGSIAPSEEKITTYAVKIGTDVPAGTYDNLAIAAADNNDEITAQAPLEIRAITVLGATLEETGTSWMDYLIYIVGIGLLAFGIGLFLKKENQAKAKQA